MNRDQQSASVSLGDKQAEEDLWHRCKAERGVWTEPMLKLLVRGEEGNKWFSLIDKVRSERTLGKAWETVLDNAGASGVDNISVAYFAKDSQARLLVIKERLANKNYRPQAIRRVEIPKLGSNELRPLGIPTVTDRVVQTALKMVIEPIFEHQFAPSSYGFRPGRQCKDALREVERLLQSGYTHIVDVDIKGYFDNIPHEALMHLIKERIADSQVLGLIEAFLTQSVIEPNGTETKPTKGSPQGGSISPLLANIYLDPLDWLLSERGLQSVRYADDIVILTTSAEQAQRALEQVQQWMERAQLTLHPEKTRLVDMTTPRAHFDFLGYRFLRTKGGKFLRLVRPKSKTKVRETLRIITRRSNGQSLEAIIQQANQVLRGWGNYFVQAHASEHQQMDGWMRKRLRAILVKRAKRRGNGQGWSHKQWPNDSFTALGLYSLEMARALFKASLRKEGAKC